MQLQLSVVERERDTARSDVDASEQRAAADRKKIEANVQARIDKEVLARVTQEQVCYNNAVLIC